MIRNIPYSYMDLIAQIGPAVRNCRIRLGMTRDEVASLAEVSPAIISQLENGHRTDFSIAMAERICTVVGLELGLALRGEAKPLELPPITRQRVRRIS
jgi:transcriptional regulator with XRE-family HTH domain